MRRRVVTFTTEGPVAYREPATIGEVVAEYISGQAPVSIGIAEPRGKVYECYVCKAQSEPIAKGKPTGWQTGHAAFDSATGAWRGRSIRCPEHHRTGPRASVHRDALVTLGEMLQARLERSP